MNPNRSSQNASPHFLALEAKPQDSEALFCLSGKSMAWGEGVWLFDLSLFLGYWRIRAVSGQVGLGHLWRNVLDRQLGEGANFGGLYKAAFAPHPWRALLLLEAMRQSQSSGLVTDGGKRGTQLLRKLSWSTWTKTAQGMAQPWKDSKRKGFHPPAFRQQLERFQTAMLRLGIERPFSSHNLNQPAVAVRFGVAVAQLWSWTLSPALDLQQFPWAELETPTPREVRRVVDYPLKLWEQIAPLLLADLDRLCGQLGGRAELILELGWELSLEEGEPLALEIGFRSPHDLREEAGKHQTLLTRMQKALEQALAQRMARSPQGMEVPWITGWRLILAKSVQVPDQVLDLFGTVQEEDSEAERLAKLENQLPVPWRRFSPLLDPEPESSFGPWEEGGALPAAQDHPAPWVRPAFYFPEARPLEGEPEGQLEFLEEASGKWWKSSQGEGRRRYYRWTDAQGKALWVFQDEEENWFVQGVYD